MSKKAPTSFRIFKRGWNTTQKGDFLFDDKAAKMVMQEYEKHGVDRMIDLEHLSIDDKNDHYDPDARGWFKLKVIDGELWAVDVKWTADGMRRLEEATQRYISPFFAYGEKSRRVEMIHNAAIVAIPATDETPALVAASAFMATSLRAGQRLATLSIKADKMDVLKKILAALGLSEDLTLEDALAAIKALQEDGESGDDGALMKKMCKALGLGDDSTEDDVMKALGDKDSEKDDEKKGELAALRANVARLSARLDTQEQRSEKDEVAKLIEDNSDKIDLHNEEFLRSQPIGVVKAFLKHAIPVKREAKSEKKRETTSGGEPTLTKEERQIAKLSNIKPEVLIAFKKREAEKKKEAEELQ